jgi:hypothetical protein
MHAHQHHHDQHEGGEGLLSWLLQPYVPRQECMFYQPDVIWTHVVSDVLITAAYFSIPFALVY